MCIRDRLKDEAEEIELQVNTDKTKVMIITRRKTREQFEIEPLILEIVNRFKYLSVGLQKIMKK